MSVVPGAFGQRVSDSATHASAVNALVSRFTETTAEQMPVYRGPEYIRSNQTVQGFPFFLSNLPQSGVLEFDGVEYPGMLLSYDLTSDQVLVMLPTLRVNIIPDNERIGSFRIGEHLFVPWRDMSGKPGRGFCDVLFRDAACVLVARRSKRVMSPPRPEDPRQFQEENHFYLSTGSGFTEFSGRKQLLQLLRDRRDEVRKLIRNVSPDFKRDPEKAYRDIIAGYARLKKTP